MKHGWTNRSELYRRLRGWRRHLPADLGWRRVFPLALMALGALLLIYVTFEYTSMYVEQRRLAREWERQNIAAVPGAPAVKRSDDALTRLLIPKIGLDALVVEGAGPRQLRLGPGRLTYTAVPGEAGNSVITAHRDTFFRHIIDLQNGDPILVKRQGKVFRYEVTGRRVVQPTDVWVLRQTTEAQLTLITCYPIYYIGPAPERLVIFSRLVEEAEEGVPVAATAAAAAAR